MNRRFALLLLSVSSAAVGLPAQDAFDFASSWRAVELVFREGCQESGVVGASLMFVRGGEEAAFAAHGLADREGRRPVDRDTIYHWASCTKTLTAIAVMQLRDRERLYLDQSIVDFVPELRRAHDPFGPIAEVTLRHLLTHSAGFRMATWPWGGDQDWHPHEPTEWSQLVAMMPYTNVEFEPGSRFSYSNPGIVFLGRAIEQLSGDDYEVYMDKNVLRPLGMSRSYFDVTPYHLARFRSHSYAVSGEGVEDHGPDFDTGITVSNGGLNAPLPDMARYLAFLLGSVPDGSDAAGVLRRSSLEEMWQPALPTGREADQSIGLAFFVQEHGGQRFLTHTGGQRDFVSFFYVHPESGTGALGAFNSSTAGPVMAAVRRACMRELSAKMVDAKTTAATETTWKGFPLRIEGPAGSRALVLTVNTGGHELHYEQATRKGDVAVVELKLVTPAPEDLVPQMITDLRVALPPKDLGGCERVRVEIATWQRGAQYFVAPAHEDAGTLALR